MPNAMEEEEMEMSDISSRDDLSELSETSDLDPDLL
eukprot:CAMPEP_0202952074 /NCGR_PEP_ID=MMETSP1395-20130829/35757_1 /ASSEMBLY_ACC=CAM_ASM_000871 /TAXON_ID=5961 /ORGANISM="Blepharisma japonicum, Strain Stock R1072" /LENGTH=35 /DNA_ID= /DNA_START= /DNA_END= /DNA_ORIENTATION=